MTTRKLTWVLVLAAPLSVSCGGSTETPDTPTPPTTLAPPVTTPVTTPPASACGLPASANPTNNCYVGTAQLSFLVNSAIDTVIATRADLVDVTDLAGSNPRVLDREGYHRAVKQELEKRGVCTLIEKEEI